MKACVKILSVLAMVWMATAVSACGNDDPPVCGDGVCEAGETSACADCSEDGGGDPSKATLIVENRSSRTIYYLYLSPCSSPDWGPDVLEGDILAPGKGLRLDGPAGCYDLRADGEDSMSWTQFGVNLELGEHVTWSLTD